MKIYFRPHAVQRMLERKISVNEVQSIIDAPDGKIQQSKDKLILYKNIGHRDDNLIAIVVVKKNNLKPSMDVISVLVNFEVKNENST